MIHPDFAVGVLTHEAMLPRDSKPGDTAPYRTLRWPEVHSGERDISRLQVLTIAAVLIVLLHYNQTPVVQIGVRTRRMSEIMPVPFRVPEDMTIQHFLAEVRTQIDAVENRPVRSASILDRNLSTDVVVMGTAESITFRRGEQAVAEGTGGRFPDHVRVVLTTLSADGGRCLGDISLLTTSERDEILVRRNSTATAYRRDATLHQLVDEQARARPNAVAVSFDGSHLTYRQLVTRADRLAHRIITARVGPTAPVGVCVHRGIDMVVAKLAVLKTGAPYVPLDPDDPELRLSRILRLAEVRLAVGTAATVARLGSQTAAVDMSSEQGCSDVPVPPSGTGEDPAMVLFTSGSTGEPKGVEVTHRAITRITDNASWFQIRSSDVVSQSSHPSFDWCAYQIWGALINGARLVIVPQPALLSPRALSALVQAEQVNTLYLTTALFHELANRDPETFAGLDRLALAGERLRAGELQRILRHAPPNHVYNVYGPTENGVYTTYHECSTADSDTVPIGLPVPNTVVYILNHRREPVPDGVIGDLYTGGDGLSPGYRGRPDLTNQRFIPNPFDSDVNRVLFDTGDRALYRPDGVIEFHGRRDFQIKVRGFRIEPEEIEAQLTRCPNVRQAVVIPSSDTDTNRYLIAFIVADGHDVDIPEIRRQLRRSLQAAMVPSRFVIIEELPLNAHGKVDRARLTAVSEPAPDDPPALEPDDIEIAVAALWKEVLQTSSIDRDDDFFSIGGDSRLVTQLVYRTNALFVTNIEPVALFEAPTIAGFADAIRHHRYTAPEPGDKHVETQHAPLSWPQESLWDACALSAGTPLYNESFMLTVREPLDTDALAESLDDLLTRHAALRTGFIETGGRVTQQVSDIRTMPLTRTDLSGVPADEQTRQAELIAVQQARLPFVLDRPPLVRAQLIRFAADRHRLYLIAHHLVSDGVSFSRALAPDLYMLYKQRVGQTTRALPPVPADYLDYARSQREQVTATSCARHLRRVASVLRGARPVELPLRQPRQAIASFRGARRTCHLPPGALERIVSLSRQRGVTPTTVLSSVFHTALHLVTGETDLVTGLVQDSRPSPDLEGVCGDFVNTTILRCDLAGDPTYTEVISRTHAAHITAHALRETPYSLIEQHVADEISTPLLRIAFSRQPDTTTLASGWDVHYNILDNGTARLDLTLFADISPSELGITFEYATDIVPEDVVARLDTAINTILSTITIHPDARLSELAGTESAGHGSSGVHQAAIQAVNEAWTGQLGVAPISSDTDFFRAGGNSMRASRLIAATRQRFNIDIRHTSTLTRSFLAESTVNGLAKGLTTLLDDRGDTRPDLRRRSARIDFVTEARLPADLDFSTSPDVERDHPESILLTGATGFLGGHLLKELLNHTDASIYCLTRATSQRHADDRIKANLRGCDIPTGDLDLRRVVPIPGDLAAPRFGLTESEYEHLAGSVDTVFHNGAWVNFIYPYEELREINVNGTIRILRLAASGRPKRLHYISTQAVFSSHGPFGVTTVDETTRPGHPDYLFMGYVESKWVSETLLIQARTRGLDVAIYRPHDISGDSGTGTWKTTGFLCSLIRSFTEIGAIPDYRLPLDLTPVDITARSVVDLALHRGPALPAFHLNNPRYAIVGDLAEPLSDAGHSVRVVPAPEWTDRLVRHTAQYPDSVIAPFTHLFTERWSDRNLTVVELYLEERLPVLDCSATWNSITDPEVACPPARQLLPLYTEYLTRTGFLVSHQGRAKDHD